MLTRLARRVECVYTPNWYLSSVNSGEDRIEFTSLDAVSGWISNYRVKPDPARLPAAVRALTQLGAFKDVESSCVYVGFVAGVTGLPTK